MQQNTAISTAILATTQPTVTVLDIGSLPLQLEDLTRERIKALPKPALQELSVLLAEMDRGIGHAREQLTAALDDLYGDAARAQLLDTGKDTGTTHLTDGDLAITVEIKKSVSWDQDELAAIAQRIASNGDDRCAHPPAARARQARHQQNPPAVIGQITLRWVYDVIMPREIIEEIRNRKRLSDKAHQWLSEGGLALLEKQIHAVTMIARSSMTYRDFDTRCATAFGSQPLQMTLFIGALEGGQ